MITLKQLTHARTLARLRSFRLAAHALHLSQPALTRSIRSLEESLGVILFDRLASGVEPTAVGEQFLRRADSVLVAHEDLVRDVRFTVGLEGGTLTVSTGGYPGDLLVPRAAAAMAARHPGVQLHLRNGRWDEVIAQVLARDADIGIAEASAAQGDERLVPEPIGRHALTVYCRAGHPILSDPAPTLDRIASFPWAAPRVPARMVSRMGNVSGRAGALDRATGHFVPAYEVEVVGAARHIVAGSDALGAAQLTQISRDVEDGTLAVVPYHGDWLWLEYCLLRLQDRSISPAAQEFMEEFRRIERALAQEEALLRRRLRVEPTPVAGAGPEL
jgi:DNA-binding transcriptional LysR family regulator